MSCDHLFRDPYCLGWINDTGRSFQRFFSLTFDKRKPVLFLRSLGVELLFLLRGKLRALPDLAIGLFGGFTCLLWLCVSLLIKHILFFLYRISQYLFTLFLANFLIRFGVKSFVKHVLDVKLRLVHRNGSDWVTDGVKSLTNLLKFIFFRRHFLIFIC
mgnify:CR=1 FL=1